MVQFDNQYRQIKIKIVYYGPALGGKTTCLQHIHRVTDPQRRTKLYSLNTASDRTLFFDLLSLNLGRIRGYRLAMQLYTVPGQVQYNATRRAVLSGADGVVFVADSQTDQRAANRQSLENLWENLAANGLSRDTLPIVFQYNKRDLKPVQSIADLDGDLNSLHAPSFATIAIRGDGVMDGFAAISERTLTAVADKLGVGGNTQAIGRLQEQVRAALQPYLGTDTTAEAPERTVTIPETATSDNEPLGQEVLVGEAVRANLAMTDLNTRLDDVTRRLERTVRGLEGVTAFGTAVTSDRDPDAVVRRLAATARSVLDADAAAVLVVPGSGGLREAAVDGAARDPLLNSRDEAGEPFAVTLLAGRESVVLARDLDGEHGSFAVAAVERAGYGSALAVPLVVRDRVAGMLTVYRADSRIALGDDDVRLATILASTAAVAHASAHAWARLEDVNRDLEREVEARTAEVRASLADVQRLNVELREKNRLVEDAHAELADLDRVKNELITRISHELRTPVTSLVTAAKILERSRDEPAEKGARFVAIIRDEADKLSEIVNSVVQASVLAAEPQSPTRQRVPVEELFRKAVAPLRDLAGDREVTLHLLTPGDLDVVPCDPETMETALRAVVKNGIEFNRAGGDVRIELRRAERDGRPWLVIRVVDTGIGIPEQDQPKVFDAFWQGGNVLTGKPRGVGLGLTIARRVIEMHGGTVRVSSRVGEGAEVTIALPADG
jgi:signal transduction histidine kinase/signal recognition particle receptor subunit beta